MGALCSPEKSAEQDTDPIAAKPQSKTLETDQVGGGNTKTAGNVEAMNGVDEEEDDAFEHFDIVFHSRQFGFGCDQGVEATTLMVSSIQKEDLKEQGMKIGALIIGCNNQRFDNKSYEDIIKTLNLAKDNLPCTIHFARDKLLDEPSEQDLRDYE